MRNKSLSSRREATPSPISLLSTHHENILDKREELCEEDVRLDALSFWEAKKAAQQGAIYSRLKFKK